MEKLDEQEYRAWFVKKMRGDLVADQATFAQIVGVTPATVSRWENARALPRLSHWEYLHDLDEILQQSPDPGRLIEILKIGAAICSDSSPLELLVAGRLEIELYHHLSDLNLGPPHKVFGYVL